MENINTYLYQDKYRIASNRLKGYDYGLNGSYFITICTRDRTELFGDVIQGNLILNKLGKIAHNRIIGIDEYYNNYVNVEKIHGVEKIHEFSLTETKPTIHIDEFIVMPNHIHLIVIIKNNKHKNNMIDNIKTRRKMLIPKIIGKFKMLSAKEINTFRNTSGQRLRQPNYYDHIIRNEEELLAIRRYIRNNPIKWENDRNKRQNIYY